MPDGACTVFPPGPGSGIALRAAGDGAAGVAGANPLPEEPGAIVAGFGDWALTYDGGRAARAQTNRPARIMDRSKFPSPCLSTCMLAASFPSGVDVSHHNPACTARQAPAGRGRIAWQDGRVDRRNGSVLPPRPLEAGVPSSVAGSTLTARRAFPKFESYQAPLRVFRSRYFHPALFGAPVAGSSADRQAARPRKSACVNAVEPPHAPTAISGAPCLVCTTARRLPPPRRADTIRRLCRPRRQRPGACLQLLARQRSRREVAKGVTKGEARPHRGQCGACRSFSAERIEGAFHRLMSVTNALEICIKVRHHKVITPRHDLGPRFLRGPFSSGELNGGHQQADDTSRIDPVKKGISHRIDPPARDPGRTRASL
jgi:hypothetical protein